MDLVTALRLNLEDRQMVTIIGSGGKTSTLYTLGRELSTRGQEVILTTTTAMYVPTLEQCEEVIIKNNIEELKQAIDLRKKKAQGKKVFIGKYFSLKNKVKGFLTSEVEEVYKAYQNYWMVVEGDGSKGKSMKIPEEWEPQVPILTSMTIVVLGLDILDKEVREEHIHRCHKIRNLLPYVPETVDENVIADLFLHPEGLLKGIPTTSKIVVLLNKALNTGRTGRGRGLAFHLLEHCRRIERVLIGEMQSNSSIIDLVERNK